MSKEKSPVQPQTVKMSYLFELAGSKKTDLYIAILFSILSGLCTFVPYLMVFRTVLFLFDGNGNSAEAMRYGLIAAAFILLRFVFQAISVSLTHYGAYSALYAVRKRICGHIGEVNLGFFTDNSTGEIKKVLMEDVERLEQFLAHQIPDITVAIVVPLAVFVYLLTVSIPMALILIVPIILTLVLQSIMMALVTPKMQKFAVVQGQLNSALLQFASKQDCPNVTFSHVSFAYQETEVLHDICLELPKGSLTAFVGASGAGKSTAAQLIPRFWDVTSGSILIGGHDVKDLQTNNLMDTVSFVFQDAFMLDDTIYQNIAIGKDNCTRQEVEEAAKAAQIHSFIQSLPNGYDTHCIV